MKSIGANRLTIAALLALSWLTLPSPQAAFAQQPNYQPLSDPGAAQLLPALPNGTAGSAYNKGSENTYGNGAGNGNVTSGGATPAARQPINDSAGGVPAIVATTTNSIDGYHVRRYLGVVRGVKVFQPTIGQNFKAGLKGIIGGNIAPYADMIEKARQEAYEQLLARSTALGANAVLALHYDTSAFGIGNSAEMGTEVICYGTAVYLEADH